MRIARSQRPTASFVLSILFSVVCSPHGFASHATSTDRCAREVKTLGTIHQVVTGRAHDVVRGFLEEANRDSLEGVRGPLEPFRSEATREKSFRLLSLGEGKSLFVFRILKKRFRENLDISGIRAVDIAYKIINDLPELSEEQWYDTHPEADWVVSRYRLRRLIRSFPQNYHGQSFQELELRDEQGAPLIFDEMISSNSLAYILARPSRFASDAESKAHDTNILMRLLKHSRAGTHIRILPVLLHSDSQQPNRYIYLQGILDELLNAGLISNHNYGFSIESPPRMTDPRYRTLIIQK